MKVLDPYLIPLEGRHLIEASAGTGKTYTISNLFVRLLLEKPELSIQHILVVTFTDAATQELKGRIRERLKLSIAHLRGETQDDFLEKLLQQKPEFMTQALSKLTLALRDFDETAIFTIHSFCQRSLMEFAFESQVMFETRLLHDPSMIIQQKVEDFWRKNFYQKSRLLTWFSIEHLNYKTPEDWLKGFRGQLHHPDLATQPSQDFVNQSELDQSLQEAQTSLKENFKELKSMDVAPIKELFQKKIFNGQIYRKPEDSLDELMRFVDRFSVEECLGTRMGELLHKFSESKLRDSLNKNQFYPENSFFSLCETIMKHRMALLSLLSQKVVGLKVTLFEELRSQLEASKQELNWWSFDDLLTRLNTALQQQDSNLGNLLQKRFPVALIDEFQDTDPVQYQIFNAIYPPNGPGTLFLIGDPKQAIYSFRGADIFTYLQAAGSAEKQSLAENWRSTPAMIQAINTLFTFKAHPNPFVYEKISYPKVTFPHEKKIMPPLTCKGQEISPMVIWQWKNDSKHQQSKSSLRTQLVDRVVQEIQKLCGNSSYALGTEPVRFRDIAVLTRSHREIRLLKQQLSKKHIPAVISQSGNIFDAMEAVDLERILSSLVSRADASSIKTALGTDMLGFSAMEIEQRFGQDQAWHELLFQWKQYGEMWQKRGFLTMFHAFSEDNSLERNLAEFEDGDRRLTNLRHLTELLHLKQKQARLQPESLLEWLRGMIRSVKARQLESDEMQDALIRLETDEDAVRLVTIHVSKGLQYPIVFCPFLWDGAQVADPLPVVSHDQASGNQRVLNLIGKRREKMGSNQEGDVLSEMTPNHPWLKSYTTQRADARKEALAENVRLSYVALTRAQYRCYVAIMHGKKLDYETSGLAWILHSQQVPLTNDLIETLKQQNPDVEQVLEGLKQNPGPDQTPVFQIMNLEEDSNSLEHTPQSAVPAPATTSELTEPRYDGPMKLSHWSISSFSGLIEASTRFHKEEVSDITIRVDNQDQTPEMTPVTPDLPSVDVPDEMESVFEFPKGDVAGTCLHQILEYLDFHEPDPEYRSRTLRNNLNQYGYGEWQSVVEPWIDQILSVPLNFVSPEFTLSRLKCQDRLSELGFAFSCSGKSLSSLLTPSHLEAHLSAAFSPDYVQKMMSLSVPAGMLKGVIDLVFRHQQRYFILDWKSNHLGNRLEYYRSDALKTDMEKHHYILQYTIYSVALHKYLRRVLGSEYAYDTHFGGVLYLYLRGIRRNQPDFGIYSARPGQEWMESLSDIFVSPPPRTKP
ncbi:MAG: exodeoxyribonuclease V subunit beta [SAR324 cluster bacterium]|nr:exodeoxyribonuclease V subunit beta [SAR324 cluster bacterium]